MSGLAPAPLLEVRPCRGLVDEELEVVVRTSSPGRRFTLRSLHQSEDQDYWEAFGHYVSDARGTITVAKHASVGGSYLGIEPMGLLWSMKPVPGSRKGLRLRKLDACSPMLLRISVYGGHVSQGFREEEALACVFVERWYLAPGVRRVEVEERGVKGTFFLPPGPGPFPGILDMWGGGGGLLEYRSALLASHGFASMAMEYISVNKDYDSPIDQSYFETAFRIIQEHPLVAADRVALYGLSLGASVSIALAAHSKEIHPRCCVCVNGGHFHYGFETLQETMDEIRKRSVLQTDEHNQVILRNNVLPIPEDPSQKLRVGNIKCPVMLIVGQDDQNWASEECAEDVEKMMKEAGNDNLLTVLSYPEAGHLIEPPYTPHFRSSNFILLPSRQKVIMLWGGQPLPHAWAQEDSWKKTLVFLRQHLCKTPAVAAAAAVTSKL